MVLQLLRKGDVVEVVVGIDAGSQGVVVFVLDEELVETLVQGFVVQVLHLAEVRLHQCKLAS